MSEASEKEEPLLKPKHCPMSRVGVAAACLTFGIALGIALVSDAVAAPGPIKTLASSVAAIVAVLAVVWWVPRLQACSVKEFSVKERFDAENESRKTLLQIVGGSILLIGLYFTAQNLKTTQEAAANNLKQAEDTLRLSQEGQITERFTRAVEQLGSEKLEIRLGGIYALERIAKDSERDHWVIMEVLSTFVREHAPIDASVKQDSKLRADVQAVLSVLGRSRIWTVESGIEQVLNLNAVNLQGLQLHRASLLGIFFYGANLKGAILSGCTFRSCNFTKANLDGALIAGADLRGCKFNNASLRQANLQGAILVGSDLEGTNFTGAHLEGADLSGVKGLTADEIRKIAFVDNATKLPEALRGNSR